MSGRRRPATVTRDADGNVTVTVQLTGVRATGRVGFFPSTRVEGGSCTVRNPHIDEDARQREKNRAAGVARGKQKAREAAAHDPVIRRAVKQWQQSDTLQEDYGYRSPVAYVMHKTHLGRRTIERALARMRASRARH